MSLAPQKLCIYYGWPSTAGGWSVAGAAALFKNYDLVVFGAGLEDSGHGDHSNTSSIIDHTDMSNTEVYGYIDSTASQATYEAAIDNWAAMGGSNQHTAGIFCDQFGYDFGVTRSKQRDIVSYIHSAGLKAFVNGWVVEDVFDDTYDATYNPSSLAHNLNSTDWYLAESYAVMNNAYDDTDTGSTGKPDWVKNKSEKLTGSGDYAGECKMAAIATMGTSTTFTQAMADYSYAAASMYGFDAWGWGETNFGSAGGPSSQPFRTRWTLPAGTAMLGSVSKSGDVYTRSTNVGFKVDVDNHTIDNEVD